MRILFVGLQLFLMLLAALGLALGISLDGIAAGLESMAPAFGRAENVDLDGIELRLLLIKNPAGANEILRTLALEGSELDVLAILNDRIADGRDVSWVWDADYEILAGRVRRVTCAGTRAPAFRPGDECATTALVD